MKFFQFSTIDMSKMACLLAVDAPKTPYTQYIEEATVSHSGRFNMALGMMHLLLLAIIYE